MVSDKEDNPTTGWNAELHDVLERRALERRGPANGDAAGREGNRILVNAMGWHSRPHESIQNRTSTTTIPLSTRFPLRIFRGLGPTLAIALAACAGPSNVSGSERQAIVDSLTRQVKAAYDLSTPSAEQRLLSLYPSSGRIVSASGGQVITSRDTLAMGVKAFWENVGVNMRQPKWIWDQMIFDVLSPTSAVMTATYHVPHLTPRNIPHTIGGAWTAVFQKRGDRWYVIQEHLSDLPPMADSTMRAMPDSAMASMPGMSPLNDQSKAKKKVPK